MRELKYIAVLSLVFQLGLSHAGEVKTDNPERKAPAQLGMQEAFYKKFVSYQELLANKEYEKALKGFKSLIEKRHVNRFEKASAQQFMGWIESKQGNHSQAAKYFEKAIESGALSNQAHLGVMQEQAKELISAGKYKQGIAALQKYYATTDLIQDSTYAIEAVAHVKLEEFEKAIELYKKAIDLSEEPQEKWNHHLYLLYVTQNEKEKASEVLEKLKKINPNNKKYWKT